MKMNLFLMLLIFSGALYSQNTSENLQVDNLVAHWDFSDPNNLTNAKIGTSLELTGTNTAVTGPFGASEIGLGSYYTATHGIVPNGGGNLVNKYSIVMDIKIPFTSVWYALYQTNISNTDDGDWFVNPTGNIGIAQAGYTSQNLVPEEWHRIAIVISNNERCDYYIDGVKALSGIPGAIDGRFALDSNVLFFADENNEDNALSVADIKIFSRDLTTDEIKSLGGYPHETGPGTLIKSYPYLQSPTSTSIYVCWAYPGENPIVEYGLSESLGNQKIPETITFDDHELKWYAAKLEDLVPSSKYYYRVKTDSLESEIYKFKTQPRDNDSTEHIRFAVFSDNQTYHQKFTEINDSLKSKATSLYGGDIEESLNLVFESGDIVDVGRTLSTYFPQYFTPSHTISTSVPYMNSIGNHEEDSPHYFKFMKYEDFGGPQGEKYYSFRIGRVLFIAINSNTQYRNDIQIEWLNQVLTSAQEDETIEWIFAANHHPGRSEVWPDGNTSYVQNRIIPTLAKYSKVDMLHYGHSHNHERGTAIDGDFRLLCIGGAGGNLDRWGEYNNQENYPEIQKAFDYHCYAIVDIDIENKFCEVKTYSIGNPDKPMDNVLIDHFIRDKANETPPTIPTLISPIDDENVNLPMMLRTKGYEGNYELMSSQFQVTFFEGDYSYPILNIQRDFEDIYGINGSPDYIPVDLNLGVNLLEYTISDINLKGKYWWRVRFRDKNLQWSDWSNERGFIVADPTNIEKDETIKIKEFRLYSNYPNPFNPTTLIQFDLPEKSIVNLSIYNSLGELVDELETGLMDAGRYSKSFDASKLGSGIYYYRLKANNYIKVQKMTFLK